MGIRERVARLFEEMPRAAEFPSQGATLFVDLERRETFTAFTPVGVTRTLLAGRGANMSEVLSRALIRQPEPIEWTYDDAPKVAPVVADLGLDGDEATSGLQH